MITLSRSFVEIHRKNHRPVASLFCNRDCFRFRVYDKRGCVNYTLTLWDKHCPETVGLWHGHKKIR